MKWIALGIGISVGVLLLVCCGITALMAAGSHGNTTTTIGNPSSSSSTGSSSHSAKVGDTITINGVSCTLASVNKLQDDEYYKPKVGNQFFYVHVKIINTSSSEAYYNPLYFHVKTGAGSISDMEFGYPSSYTVNNTLVAGKLAADGSVEGDIVFQAPIGDHQAALTWQPDYFANQGDNTWNLGL